MTQNVPLDTGDEAAEAFFDATQEMLSGLAVNLRLEVLNPTTIRVPAGTGHDQVSLSIDGQYRFITAAVTRAMAAGGAGVYDIFVTSAANDPATHAPPGDDYSFALAIVATGGSPAGVALKRLIGRLEWSGAAIVSLTQLAPILHPHARTHDDDGTDPLNLPPWHVVASEEFGGVAEESIEWFADPTRPVAYYRAHGVVRLRGVAVYEGSAAPTPLIFALPAGSRPPHVQSWACPIPGTAPPELVEVTVNPGGGVSAIISSGAVALDSVAFRVA